MTVNFNDMSQVYALRTLLRSEAMGQDSRLTDSERFELRSRINTIVDTARQDAAQAKAVFDGYQGLLGELRGNAFKVEVLRQKTDALAAADVEVGLRGDLDRQKARVNYRASMAAPVACRI